jgi:ubiquinone/menaquinone biosynthesis C-methylase UbiE
MLDAAKIRVMRRSRAKKLDQFYSLCRGGRILDVGVAGKVRTQGDNAFLESYRFEDSSYVGLGVEDLTALSAKHPRKRFLRYDGRIFPFSDGEFDWAFSNAVIEHVGDREAQVFFLNEMLRVAKKVYFTTPNKFFPVESHTNSLILHWLPGDVFYRWCALRNSYWSKRNLNLLGLRDLRAVLRSSNASWHKVFVNRLLGWPMTFSVACHK